MPDSCIDCEYLREAALTYYYCGITGQTLGYETGVDEAAWADDETCPLGAEEGDEQ